MYYVVTRLVAPLMSYQFRKAIHVCEARPQHHRYSKRNKHLFTIFDITKSVLVLRGKNAACAERNIAQRRLYRIESKKSQERVSKIICT